MSTYLFIHIITTTAIHRLILQIIVAITATTTANIIITITMTVIAIVLVQLFVNQIQHLKIAHKLFRVPPISVEWHELYEAHSDILVVAEANEVAQFVLIHSSHHHTVDFHFDIRLLRCEDGG